MEVVKHLKQPAQPNPDNEDDINSLDNIQNEYSTQDNSAQNNATDTTINNDTTQNIDNVENQDHFDKKELLPDEVARYTETILQNPDAEKQMENYLFFHTMDFAGQPVYSVTLPVFLPPKGIYLLVHSLENDLLAQAAPIATTGAVERKNGHDPMTNVDHLKFWLSLIDANSTQEGCSPVFVVSTHADKPFEEDVQHTGRTILATLKAEGFAPGRHVVREIYTVDNTISGITSREDAGIKELKTQICKKAKSLPQMNEDIPIRWLHFEKKLGHLVRDEKRKHISFKEAEQIALQCEVVSSDELKTLLNYLHDLKVIIHLPETGVIIIDTQWLLDMFAKVITVQPIECQEGYEDEWQKLENQGIIDVKFLEHLWKDLLNDDTSVESLITIMERFSLVCKQRDGSFLVPAMLSNSTIDETHELMKSCDDCASPLVVRFKSSHLPLGLFPRLLVAVDEMCNLKWKSSTPPHLSRNFARFYFQLDDDYEISLVFMADTATIAVTLIGDVNSRRRDDVYVQQCRSILEFLRKTLQEMITSFPWMKSLAEFDYCIRCPICLKSCKKHNKKNCCQDSCAHLVSEKELLQTTRPRCQKNPTVKENVMRDTFYSHWFPRSKCQSKELKKDVENSTGAICSSSRKDEGPLQFTHDLLVKDMDLKTKDTLSKVLTVREKEWKTFAIDKVKLSVEDVNFLDVREKNPVLEILNDHCGDWSVDELYTAIVDCGANADADRYL